MNTGSARFPRNRSISPNNRGSTWDVIPGFFRDRTAIAMVCSTIRRHRPYMMPTCHFMSYTNRTPPFASTSRGAANSHPVFKFTRQPARDKASQIRCLVLAGWPQKSRIKQK